MMHTNQRSMQPFSSPNTRSSTETRDREQWTDPQRCDGVSGSARSNVGRASRGRLPQPIRFSTPPRGSTPGAAGGFVAGAHAWAQGSEFLFERVTICGHPHGRDGMTFRPPPRQPPRPRPRRCGPRRCGLLMRGM